MFSGSSLGSIVLTQCSNAHCKPDIASARRVDDINATVPCMTASKSREWPLFLKVLKVSLFEAVQLSTLACTSDNFSLARLFVD